MRKLIVILFLFPFTGVGQNVVTICNGDSVYLYNNWETQTGIYTDGATTTSLIVNPSPTITGNFLLNGNAIQANTNTYQLTQAIGNQSGSAWNSVTLDLTQPFNFDVDLFFGYNNGGADGIAFLLQQVNTSVGSSGGGLGYQGISPSFCVEFDTWQNTGWAADPSYDHIAIQRDGDLNHNGVNNLDGPIGFPPGNINIEDGLWHNVIFSWDPTTFNFKVVFDGTVLFNYTNDIVTTIFNGNPYVYWGFTAATGGANNLQQFRVNTLSIQLSDVSICQYDTIQIDPQINSNSYSYLWSPNYNIDNNTSASSLFFPDTTTTYLLEITNSYGCSSIDSFILYVDSIPMISQTMLPVLCVGDNPISLNFASPSGGSYTGNGVANNIFTPDIGAFGTNLITYTYTDLNGCTNSINQDIIVGDYTSNTSNITECDNYIWPINGQMYDISGVYIDSSINSSGCIHIDTLELIINSSSVNTNTIRLCDTTYIWPINGQSYNLSGTYTDTSINNSSCMHIEILNLIIGDDNDIELFIDHNNISCYGYNDGSIILNPSGISSPYQFTWNTGITSNTISSLSAGNYAFTVSDINGCQIDSILTIEEPDRVIFEFSSVSPICRNDSAELTINILNPSTNVYTLLLEDSIYKSFVIDSTGLLLSQATLINLTPNYSRDLILISATDNNGCVTSINDTFPIIVNQLPIVNLNLDDICVGVNSFVLNQGTPAGGNYYIDGLGTNFFDVENLQPSVYSIVYEYTDPVNSCSNSIEKSVNIYESPEASFYFSPQPTDITESDIHFINNSLGISHCIWDLGDGNSIYDSLDFWYSYQDTGTFIIRCIVINQYNCTDTLIDTLTINPLYNTSIPSAFTPNNDGDNDVFYPQVIGESHYTMEIFNRWGEIIYRQDNGQWDGKINNEIAPIGIYMYNINVYDYKQKLFEYKGLLYLMR